MSDILKLDENYIDRYGNKVIGDNNIYDMAMYDTTVSGVETSWERNPVSAVDFENGDFQSVGANDGWTITDDDMTAPYSFLSYRDARWKSVNLMSGASVTTDSGMESIGAAPGLFVDFTMDAGWGTANNDEYNNAAIYDLGESSVVSAFYLKPSFGSVVDKYLSAYRIGVSSTGFAHDDFEVVISGSLSDYDNIPRIHYIPSRNVRYVKFFADKNNGGSSIYSGKLAAYNNPQWSFWGISENGSHAGTYGEISQDIDLTGVDRLYFDMRMFFSSSTQAGSLSVRVDGAQVRFYNYSTIVALRDSNQAHHSFLYEEFADVSSYTGMRTVSFRYTAHDTLGMFVYQMWLDNISTMPGWLTEPVSSVRGGRREFPEKVLFVSDGGGLSIIDAFDYSLWMRINITPAGALTASVRAVCGRNGKVYCATNDGLIVVDFINNRFIKYNSDGKFYRNSIRDRHARTCWRTLSANPKLSSTIVNHVELGHSEYCGDYLLVSTPNGLDILKLSDDTLYSSREPYDVIKSQVFKNNPDRFHFLFGNRHRTWAGLVESARHVCQDDFNCVRYIGDNTVPNFKLSGENRNGLYVGYEGEGITISGTKTVSGYGTVLQEYKLPSCSFSAKMKVKINSLPDRGEGGLHFGVTDSWPLYKETDVNAEEGLFLSATNGLYGMGVENDSFENGLTSMWRFAPDEVATPFNLSSHVQPVSGTLFVTGTPSYGLVNRGCAVTQRYIPLGTESFTCNLDVRVVHLYTEYTQTNRHVCVMFGLHNGPYTNRVYSVDGCFMALYCELASAPEPVYCVGKIDSGSMSWDLSHQMSKYPEDATEDALFQRWSFIYNADAKSFSALLNGNFVGEVDCTGFMGDRPGVMFGVLTKGFTPGAADSGRVYFDNFEINYGQLDNAKMGKYTMSRVEVGTQHRNVDGAALVGLDFYDDDGTPTSTWKTWEIVYDNNTKCLRGSVDGTSVGPVVFADIGPESRLCIVCDAPATTSGNNFVDFRIKDLEVTSSLDEGISGRINSITTADIDYDGRECDFVYFSTDKCAVERAYVSKHCADDLSSLDDWSVFDYPGAANSPSSWYVYEGITRQSSAIYGKTGDVNTSSPYGTCLIYSGEGDVLQGRTLDFSVDLLPFSSSGVIGLSFCRQDEHNFYYFISNTSSQFIEIGKVIAGVRTILVQNTDNYYLLEDRWHRVRVDPREGKIKVYVSGVIQLEAEDTELSSGDVALISNYNSGGWYRDFIVDYTSNILNISEGVYGIEGSGAQYEILGGGVESVALCKSEEGAGVGEGVSYVAVSDVKRYLVEKIAGPSIIGTKPADQVRVGVSYSGDMLFLWATDEHLGSGNRWGGRNCFTKRDNGESNWELAFFHRDYQLPYMRNIFSTPDDCVYLLARGGSAEWHVSEYDRETNFIEGKGSAPAYLDTVYVYGSWDTQDYCRGLLLMVDSNARYWSYDLSMQTLYGFRTGLSLSNTGTRSAAVYFPPDDKLYAVSLYGNGLMSTGNSLNTLWRQEYTDSASVLGEGPHITYNPPISCFFRPYDECIYYCHYNPGDFFEPLVFVRYSPLRKEWSFVKCGDVPLRSNRFHCAYSIGADCVYLHSGQEHNQLYKIYFDTPKLLEKHWLKKELPENSEEFKSNLCIFSSEDKNWDTTFINDDYVDRWYPYTLYVDEQQTEQGLLIEGFWSTSGYFCIELCDGFLASDFDFTVEVKLITVPGSMSEPDDRSRLLFGVSDFPYAQSRDGSDKLNYASNGISGLWLGLGGIDGEVPGYTMYKLEEYRAYGVYDRGDTSIPLFGDEGTEGAGFRKWRIVYDHSEDKLEGYIDNIKVGEVVLNDYKFNNKIYVSFGNRTGSGVIEYYLRNFKVNCGSGATLVDNSYMLLEAKKDLCPVYYRRNELLLKKSSVLNIETRMHVEDYTVSGSAYVFDICDVFTGDVRIKCSMLHHGGSRRLGIYCGGYEQLMSSYINVDFDWCANVNYEVKCDGVFVALYAGGVKLLETPYDSLPPSNSYNAMPYVGKDLCIEFGSKQPIMREIISVADRKKTAIHKNILLTAQYGGNAFYGWAARVEETDGTPAMMSFFPTYPKESDCHVYMQYPIGYHLGLMSCTIYHDGVVNLPVPDDYITNPLTTVKEGEDEHGQPNPNAVTLTVRCNRYLNGGSHRTPGVQGSGWSYLGTYSNVDKVVASTDGESLHATISALLFVDTAYKTQKKTVRARIYSYKYNIGSGEIVTENGYSSCFNAIDLKDKKVMWYIDKDTSPGLIGDDINTFKIM